MLKVTFSFPSFSPSSSIPSSSLPPSLPSLLIPSHLSTHPRTSLLLSLSLHTQDYINVFVQMDTTDTNASCRLWRGQAYNIMWATNSLTLVGLFPLHYVLCNLSGWSLGCYGNLLGNALHSEVSTLMNTNTNCTWDKFHLFAGCCHEATAA